MTAHVDDVDWARTIERMLYLVPPVIGVGIVGVLQDLEPGVPGLAYGLVLLGSFGYLALSVGLAVATFFDARRVGRQPRASGNWLPNPWLNAGAALVAAPVAGVAYLARRHQRFGTPPGWGGWWLIVAVSLTTTLFGAVAAAIAIVLVIPGLLTAGMGIAGAIAFGSFPIAIHRDAAYVSTYGETWCPNPGVYLGIAFLSLVVPPLQPVVAGYYLLRRRRTIEPP